MAGAIRNQIIPGTPYQDGSGGGNVTYGRHTLFGVLSLTTGNPTSTGSSGAKALGGMQSFAMEETNGTQFRPQAGNDWLEPVFGMRQWQGNGSRFQIRGADLQELLAREYTNLADIDFRFCPFTWQYSYNYAGPTGLPVIENALWSWMTIWVTSYRISFADPMNLLSEDFSFIGKGYSRVDNGGDYQLQNSQQLWGAGRFLMAGNDTSSVTGAVGAGAAGGAAALAGALSGAIGGVAGAGGNLAQAGGESAKQSGTPGVPQLAPTSSGAFRTGGN